MISSSAGSRRPGLSRIDSGMRALPISWRVAAIPSRATSTPLKPDLQPEAGRNSGDQQAVLKGAFVIAAHLVEPGYKSVPLDAIDDFRGGVFGIQKVDRPAVPRRRKHRSERRRGATHLGWRHRSRALRRLFHVCDLRKPENGLLGTRNHVGRPERVGLRNHRADLIVDDEQLLGTAIQFVQCELELLDTIPRRRSTSTIKTPRAAVSAPPSPSTRGTTSYRGSSMARTAGNFVGSSVMK